MSWKVPSGEKERESASPKWSNLLIKSGPKHLKRGAEVPTKSAFDCSHCLKRGSNKILNQGDNNSVQIQMIVFFVLPFNRGLPTILTTCLFYINSSALKSLVDMFEQGGEDTFTSHKPQLSFRDMFFHVQTHTSHHTWSYKKSHVDITTAEGFFHPDHKSNLHSVCEKRPSWWVKTTKKHVRKLHLFFFSPALPVLFIWQMLQLYR